MRVYKKLCLVNCLVLLIIFAAGCENKKDADNPYQLMSAEDGRIYRLNKKTGQIVVLEGDKIIPLEVERRKKNKPEQQVENKPIIADKQDITPTPEINPVVTTPLPVPVAVPVPNKIVPDENPYHKLKQWGDEHLSGKNLRVSFQSYWENNQLFYSLEVFPYLSLKKMLDKKESDIYYQHKWHGFIIKLVDNNNDTVKEIPISLGDMSPSLNAKGKLSSLKIEEKIDLLEDENIRITGYKVDWKLDNILIPEYKFKNKVEDLIDTYSWYGEVDPKFDVNAPEGAKYWWMTFPNKKKIYFSTEEELLQSYQSTIEKIIKANE
jgi:hypothetical protein